MGDWIVPKAGLDAVEKRKIPARNRMSIHLPSSQFYID
jgi:hypothetical protein